MSPSSENRNSNHQVDELQSSSDASFEPVEEEELEKKLSFGKRFLRGVFRFIFPIIFIAGAILTAQWMIRTSPKARRRRRRAKRRAHLVQTKKVHRSKHNVNLKVMGTVIPAKRVTLQPQVQGRIVSIGKAMIPGGYVKKRAKLFRIEANDYWLAVKQQKSALASAKAQLAQEKGRQAVAAKEYELLGKKMNGGDRDLMLRKPQLDAAKAAVDQAKAVLAKAQLNLGRTLIRAPFNAIVETRTANVGSRVTTGSPLATLVGTDAYWIEALIPVDQLRWVRFPSQGKEKTRKEKTLGSLVLVRDPNAWGIKEKREGRILRLLPGLDEKGRMARVLVEVKDPMALGESMAGKPKLLMSSFVSVSVSGGEMQSVVALERKYLRDDDTVWVRDKDGKLDIRKVSVAFRGRDEVYISKGLAHGHEVVTTNLSGPVQGMPLRTSEMEREEKSKGSSHKGDRNSSRKPRGGKGRPRGGGGRP